MRHLVLPEDVRANISQRPNSEHLYLFLWDVAYRQTSAEITPFGNRSSGAPFNDFVKAVATDGFVEDFATAFHKWAGPSATFAHVGRRVHKAQDPGLCPKILENSYVYVLASFADSAAASETTVDASGSPASLETTSLGATDLVRVAATDSQDVSATVSSAAAVNMLPTRPAADVATALHPSPVACVSAANFVETPERLCLLLRNVVAETIAAHLPGVSFSARDQPATWSVVDNTWQTIRHAGKKSQSPMDIIFGTICFHNMQPVPLSTGLPQEERTLVDYGVRAWCAYRNKWNKPKAATPNKKASPAVSSLAQSKSEANNHKQRSSLNEAVFTAADFDMS